MTDSKKLPYGFLARVFFYVSRSHQYSPIGFVAMHKMDAAQFEMQLALFDEPTRAQIVAMQHHMLALERDNATLTAAVSTTREVNIDDVVVDSMGLLCQSINRDASIISQVIIGITTHANAAQVTRLDTPEYVFSYIWVMCCDGHVLRWSCAAMVMCCM